MIWWRFSFKKNWNNKVSPSADLTTHQLAGNLVSCSLWKWTENTLTHTPRLPLFALCPPLNTVTTWPNLLPVKYVCRDTRRGGLWRKKIRNMVKICVERKNKEGGKHESLITTRQKTDDVCGRTRRDVQRVEPSLLSLYRHSLCSSLHFQAHRPFFSCACECVLLLLIASPWKWRGVAR